MAGFENDSRASVVQIEQARLRLARAHFVLE